MSVDMNPIDVRRRTKELDPSSFQALLDSLAPESSQAGIAYEQLRRNLVRFFRWNGCEFQEDLADLTLDRLARKIVEGKEEILNISKYALGIARLIVLEQRAKQMREKQALLQFAESQTVHPGSAAENYLDDCLGRLTPSDQRLIHSYYSGDSSERIRNRQQMAADLSVSLNTLRNRALRLRKELEGCIQKRIEHADRVMERRRKHTPDMRGGHE